ncbi:unnamed protein product, partial [Musa banksii]
KLTNRRTTADDQYHRSTKAILLLFADDAIAVPKHDSLAHVCVVNKVGGSQCACLL